MTKTNKKNMYLLILVTVSITVIAVSFAYFAAQSSSPANTSVNVGTEVSEKLIFTPGDPLSINANQENFGDGDGSVSSESTSSATLIANSSKGSASGVYQVYLDITANDFIYTVNESTPELILTVTDPNGNNVTSIDGLSYKTVIDASTGESIVGFDITTFKGLIKIKEDEAISTTNSTTGTTENWTIKVTFVNLVTSQALNEGKTLVSNFILQEEKRKSGADTVIDLHGGVDGTNDLYYTNNAEYRYTGLTPDNYVIFNEEMWRIIGVFDDASHGITDTNLIKIIKEEPIGDYMFDTDEVNGTYGYNSWSDSEGGAELNQLLNGYYYNSTEAPNNLAHCGNVDYYGYQASSCDFTATGLNFESSNMIQEVTWYLGAVDEDNAPEAYASERGSTASASPGANLTYVASVGLIYISDYGYSAPQTYWNYTMFHYGQISWMNSKELENPQPSINSRTQSDAFVYSIYNDGSAFGIDAGITFSIKPSLYLKEEIKITGGTGTESDPYTLSM